MHTKQGDDNANTRGSGARWRGSVAACAALALAACGGGSIDDETKANEAAADERGDCGDLNMAVNPWVGYEADAYVVGAVAEQRARLQGQLQGPQGGRLLAGLRHRRGRRRHRGLGPPRPGEEVLRRAAATAARRTSGRPATSASSAGTSRRGSPRSTRTSSTGRTSTSTPRTSPPPSPAARASSSAPTRRTSSSTRRSSSNLDLDFKVVFSGSEAASITAFQQAEKNKEFLIGYFYEPQWLFADLPLAKVALPAYRTAARTTRQRSPATTRRPTLKKIVSTSWADEGVPAVDLVKNFKWTNDDQNLVAKYISEDGMSPEDAAAEVDRGEPGQGRRLATR